MKLSIAIATHNEEKNIAACILSVKDIAGEIIVVDGASEDKTVQIAKDLGATVFNAKHEAMFHKNKQLAIDRCRGDWILQLDADEQVSKELKEEIIEKIIPKSKTENPEQPNGYWIPRKNFFLGKFLKKGGQYPDYSLRLYKKGKGRLPCKSVHEQAEVEGKKGYLKNPLLHYSYPDFSHYLEHFNLYTSFLSKDFESNNQNINLKSAISYLFLKPIYWFFLTYFRHKGFQDGFSGFVFSFFSSLRFPVAYIKYWEIKKSSNRR